MDTLKNRLLFGNMLVMFLLVVSLWTTRGQAASGSAPSAAPVANTFAYEGRVGTSSGRYDFKFRLFDAATGGSLVSSSVRAIDNVLVDSGEYVVTLNFGAAPFSGDARYLEVQYRLHSADANAPYTLQSRQPLLTVPYALSLRPGAAIAGDIAAPGAVMQAKNTGSGIGVRGEAVSGIGLMGITQAAHTLTDPAIYGLSTGSGGIGVIGEANTGNAWGVYGTSTEGTGIYAASTGGRAIHAAGDATQDRDRGGWVKAMAYIDPNQGDPIQQCYNSQMPLGQASSGDCGLTYTRWTAFGYHQIDFGFAVNDRFISLTVKNGSSSGPATGGNVEQASEPTSVLVRTFYTVFDPYDADNTYPTTVTPFFIFVY